MSDGARLRLALPFAAKGELTLKKIGLELVVGVGAQRRTIMLPPPLAAMRPVRRAVRRRSAGGELRWTLTRPGRCSSSWNGPPPQRRDWWPRPLGARRPGCHPPAGRRPATGEPPPRELELLTGLLGTMRELVPEELAQGLSEALRELLLAIRALIDWYLERAEQRAAEPPEVEDIPIS